VTRRRLNSPRRPGKPGGELFEPGQHVGELGACYLTASVLFAKPAVLPSMKNLAALDLPANSATLQTFDAVSRLADIYRMPTMAQLIEGIKPRPTAASALQASGIMSQLYSIVAAFGPQRIALDAIAASQVAHNKVFHDQMLQILSAQSSIGRLVSNTGYSTALAPLFDAVNRYGQVQAQLGALTISPNRTPLLRGNSTQSGHLYDTYLSGLPARPIARRAAVARQAGDTQTGLLIAESLTGPDLSTDDRAELAEQLTLTVLEPWQTGPSDARTELFGVLADLDPGLPGWLKAAWDDIVRDGPKAASKIANCSVECIDRALRVAASPGEVATWLTSIPAKKGYMDGGSPTRRAKIMFIMRNRADRDTRLAIAQVDALVSLIQEVVNNLQSVKHGEAPSIATMRSWVLAAEGALAQLFLHV
jgi:Predicted pPIWI-associating nuclease